MGPLLRAYRFVNLLSIDVAVGAAVGAEFFARILQVRLFPQAYIVLALAVWILYTGDHLLDAKRLTAPASTPRHQLHQRHFRVLSISVVIAILVATILALFIRTQLMIPGICMALLCATYLVMSRWLRFAKELMGTILYAGGVLLPSLALNHDLTPPQAKLVAEFVLLVLINMLLFAQMSYVADLRDRQPSFPTTVGLRASRWVIGGLFVAFGLISLIAETGRYLGEQVTLVAMAAVLLLIFLFPRYFILNERYRLVGDAVFLMPSIRWILIAILGPFR